MIFFFPIKKFKFSNEKPKWLNNDIILLMKERDRCLSQYAKTRLEKDKKDMRKARNITNLAVKNARAEFIKEQLEFYKNDAKKSWKNIATVIPKNKSGVTQNFNNIHDDNNDIIGQEHLAEHVNRYFSDIGLKLDEHIPRHLNVTQQQVYHDIDSSIDVFKCIREEDLVTELNRISVYNSSRILNVPSYF